MKQAKKAGHQTGQRQCPHVREPFDECHCNRLNSLSTQAAIYYCGGNFEGCEIYCRHAGTAGGKRQVPPGPNDPE